MDVKCSTVTGPTRCVFSAKFYALPGLVGQVSFAKNVKTTRASLAFALSIQPVESLLRNMQTKSTVTDIETSLTPLADSYKGRRSKLIYDANCVADSIRLRDFASHVLVKCIRACVRGS